MKFLNLLLLFVATGVSAFGQTVDGKQITRAELVTDADDFTKPFTVGIRFVLEPDWYLYWKNPGDSGLPIDVQWDLPKSWKASELRHPVPAKFAYDNLVSYGYKKEVVLLATITPGSESLDVLKAKLDWLVCKESCIRGKADVSLSLKSNIRSGQEIITSALNKFPGSSGDLSFSLSAARMRETESGWEAEVDLTGRDASSISDFYPESSEEIVIDYTTIGINNGVLRFRFDRQDAASNVIEVRGLFVTGSKAYEGSIPLHFKSM